MTNSCSTAKNERRREPANALKKEETLTKISRKWYSGDIRYNWFLFVAGDRGTVMEAENKSVVRRVFEEIFNQRRFDLIPTLYCGDCEGMDPANPSGICGHEALTDLLTLHCKTFPDHRYTVYQIIAEGEFVSVRWSVTGLGRKVAQDATFEGLSLCEFRDKKICRLWQHWDNLGLMQAMGVVTPELKVADELQSLGGSPG